MCIPGRLTLFPQCCSLLALPAECWAAGGVFVEEEWRGEAGGVQEQDPSIACLLPKAFCTIDAFSWQKQFGFRRDFVTLFILHPAGASHVGNTAPIHW